MAIYKFGSFPKDMMTIAGFGVMATPAVVVNGVVKCVGKVPDRDEIAGWLR